MKRTLSIVLLALFAGFAGSYLYQRIFPAKGETVYVQARDGRSEFASYSGPAENPVDFAAAAAASTESVVFIRNISSATYSQNDWWDWFFNQRSGQTMSSGSGVIFTKDGYIVTNNHVIENSTTLEVIHNKRTYTATVIGTDPSTDLALLKIEANNLPNIPIGKSREVNVGEWVIAIGNPFNLTSTVTAGIISAKGRDINILGGQFPLESFLQTDAAINPGNSGGALVNARGELIGINTAILSRTGAYNGYGFAIPVDIVGKVVNDLIKFGEVQKAFFGGDVVNIDNEVATKLALQDYAGVALNYIERDGSAEKAGLQQGDVILKIDGEAIESKSGFDEKISYYKPGDKIKVVYKRSNKVDETEIELTNREGTTALLKREIFTSDYLGADLEVVSKVERERLGISSGIRLSKIRRGLLVRLGMQEGFIITNVNKTTINSAKQLKESLENIRGRVLIEGLNDSGRKFQYSYIF